MCFHTPYLLSPPGPLGLFIDNTSHMIHPSQHENNSLYV
jgi:hypothetical protein